MSVERVIETDVVVAGGGPAGMVLALMLSARGIRTVLLEQHPDFEREYRGEVLMPRFVQMMKQLGLFEFLETYPHLKLQGFEFFIGAKRITTIRVDQISPEAPFILWMPQTVMLNALHEKAKHFGAFQILFNAHASGLIREQGKVTGLLATVDHESTRILSKLVVGADGRSSTVRAQGGFDFEYLDHDFDILWFTIPKPAGYDDSVRAFITKKHNCLALPKLPHHLQCGILLRAGEYAEYRKKGIDFLKKDIHDTHPLFAEFADGLKDFSPFSLLAAKAERVRDWAQEGLLLVGDAAHTCSPAGAIGVSVAVATAIVAADIIHRGFQAGDLSKKTLDGVQKVRYAEVKEIQNIQNQAAHIVGRFSFLGRVWTALIAGLAAKTGLFVKFQRRLMVMREPLPIADDWRMALEKGKPTPTSR